MVGGLFASFTIFSLYAGGAIGGFIYTHSILGLSLSTLATLSSSHSILILFGFQGGARFWIISSGVLTITANSPTTGGGSAPD